MFNASANSGRLMRSKVPKKSTPAKISAIDDAGGDGRQSARTQSLSDAAKYARCPLTLSRCAMERGLPYLRWRRLGMGSKAPCMQ